MHMVLDKLCDDAWLQIANWKCVFLSNVTPLSQMAHEHHVYSQVDIRGKRVSEWLFAKKNESLDKLRA